MDEHTLVSTRRSLHAVAELVIAGPHDRSAGTIRLRVTPGGFGGVATALRVEGTDLVWDCGRTPIAGTYRDLATVAGLEAGPPVGLYADTSGADPDDTATVDPAAAEILLAWFAAGDAALRTLAPSIEPVVWPEHSDLATSLDEVNYGVSPGEPAIRGPTATSGRGRRGPASSGNAPLGALHAAGALLMPARSASSSPRAAARSDTASTAPSVTPKWMTP